LELFVAKVIKILLPDTYFTKNFHLYGTFYIKSSFLVVQHNTFAIQKKGKANYFV